MKCSVRSRSARGSSRRVLMRYSTPPSLYWRLGLRLLALSPPTRKAPPLGVTLRARLPLTAIDIRSLVPRYLDPRPIPQLRRSTTLALKPFSEASEMLAFLALNSVDGKGRGRRGASICETRRIGRVHVHISGSVDKLMDNLCDSEVGRWKTTLM